MRRNPDPEQNKSKGLIDLVREEDTKLHHLVAELLGVVTERTLEEVAARRARHPLNTGPDPGSNSTIQTSGPDQGQTILCIVQ